MNKDRNISNYEYIQALSREYICLEIRSKIYTHKNDKDYFKALMSKKGIIIQSLCDKNHLDSIFATKKEYNKAWEAIVPEFGFPNFIYNILNVSEEKLKFPFKGTVIKVNNEDIYGVSERVDFKTNDVLIKVYGEIVPKSFPLDSVTRLDHVQTDQYFYYYPDSLFRVKCEENNVVLKLHYFNFESKTALMIHDDDMTLSPLSIENISRII